MSSVFLGACLLLASGVFAQDEAAPVKQVVTVESSWSYDADDLKEAVDDAEIEDGVQTGSVFGRVVYSYSDGSSRDVDAKFTQSLKRWCL